MLRAQARYFDGAIVRVSEAVCVILAAAIVTAAAIAIFSSVVFLSRFAGRNLRTLYRDAEPANSEFGASRPTTAVDRE